MPFTLAHSAAVLPFVRSKYFSATGLVIGTMAPDFEYFLRMNVQGIYGHTILGVFYFDVPVSILLAFVFHSVAKRNLIDNLPVFFQSRFQEIRNSDFTAYFKEHKLIFVLSVIFGTATHIIWDGFTHDRQFFVQALPSIYKNRTVDFMDVDYPLWYALQYISTAVGLLAFTIYVFMMKPIAGVFNRPRFIYWVLLVVIMAIILYVRLQFRIMNEKYVVIVITIVSSFCIGITILGLISFKKRNV